MEIDFLYSLWNKSATEGIAILRTSNEVTKDRKKWYKEQQKSKTKESQAWDEFFKITLQNFIWKWLIWWFEVINIKKGSLSFVIPFSLKHTRVIY